MSSSYIMSVTNIDVESRCLETEDALLWSHWKISGDKQNLETSVNWFKVVNE